MSKKGEKSVDLFAKAFADLVDLHRAALGVSANQLFGSSQEATGSPVDLSYLARWKAGERGVTRDLAARMAITITRAYADRAGQAFELPDAERLTSGGWENIGWTLERFYSAAGHFSRKVELAEPLNISWGQIRRENKIRIGWVECPGWADKPLEGPCIRIATTLAKLLDLEPTFEMFSSWDDLRIAVQTRVVHVTAPIMINTLDRLKSFRFSDPVGKVDFQVRALGLSKRMPEGEILRFEKERSRLLLGYVRGEVGNLASRLVSNSVGFTSFSEAVEWLLDPEQTVTRVLVGESGTLRDRMEANLGLLRSMDISELKHFKFHVCFAAHEHEPDLIGVINTALKGGADYFNEELPDPSIKSNP